jgi:C-terminal processing protease CtpA/Prc
MPGARSVEVSRGYFRIANSNPPEWEAQPHPFQSYSMTVDDGLSTNHRDHPVAVLVDGKTVSAADYFAYAAAEFTDALIVGPEGTAGAFGFGGQPFSTVSGPVIPLQHRVDPLRVETPEGEFLERRSVMPDMVVPYDPSDVAQGVDTVLEAAAAALLAQ